MSYFLIYKIKGSFSDKAPDTNCCGTDTTYAANWTYREVYGPLDPYKSQHHVRFGNPDASGTWSYKLVAPSQPSGDCDVHGTWSGVGGNPTLAVTEVHLPGADAGPGFDGAALVISAGAYGPSQNMFSACQGAGFFGPTDGSSAPACGGDMRQALVAHHGACNAENWFTTDLSVSDSGLEHHHLVYDVSNSRPGSERVASNCNYVPYAAGSGYTRTCSYSWSGTVTFQPAG